VRTDNCASIFWDVFGGRLAVVDLPQDAGGLRLADCVPQSSELLAVEKAFATLLAEGLYMGSGVWVDGGISTPA